MNIARLLRAAIGALCVFAASAGIAQASSPDASWLKTAASANMCEIQAGRLAENRSTDAQWRSFGTQMVNDHTTALAGIQSMAAQKGVTLPGGLAPADAGQISKLSRLHGTAFDQAYRAFAVKSHTQANALYSAEIASGQDSDVRSLASKQLPTVQNHLSMADKMAGMSMDNLSPDLSKTSSGKN